MESEPGEAADVDIFRGEFSRAEADGCINDTTSDLVVLIDPASVAGGVEVVLETTDVRC